MTQTQIDVVAMLPQLAAQGHQRVIVGLDTGAALGLDNARINTSGLVNTDLIAKAEKAVSERLVTANVTDLGGLVTMPYLTLDVNSAEALVAIASDPAVASIEPDTLSAPTLDVSATVIDARAAWSNGYTGDGYAVAILDTGVLTTHTHLAGKLASEACYSSNDANSGATSLCPGGVTSSTAAGAGMACTVAGCDHGTHVAAIATSSNATYKGIGNGAKLVAIQVFTKFTSTTQCGATAPCVLSYGSDWLKGLDRVLQLSQSGTKIAAVNMSLGGGQFTSACDATYPSAKTAIDNLAAAGIATVIAAGNDGYTNAVAFPGCLSGAVTVGATTKTDGIPSYTNLSAGVDVLAPGSSITAAVSSSTTAVGTKSGTSMASPHVAGAFAVLRQAKPTMTVAEGVAALQATGKAITDTRSGGAITKERIDVGAAISAMLEPTPAGCTRQAPTVSVAQPAAVASPSVARFVVTLKNNDPTVCGASSFDLETTPPAGWTATNATPAVGAGNTVIATIDITPPSTLLSGDTSFTFTAVNIGAREIAGKATAKYAMSCAHVAPTLALAPAADGVLTASITNMDPTTCSATMFHVRVQATATVTPSSNDVELSSGSQSDVALPFDPKTAPGDYPVAITLTTDDGTVVAQADGMATVDAPTDIPSADLGCSTSGKGGAGTGVLVALGLVSLRRRRR
ncbi:MAG TPA: S8 family serine peptidase [Kofleriaceae bacterium]|jgi:uncharacterized protein (TIGR03382 family)